MWWLIVIMENFRKSVGLLWMVSASLWTVLKVTALTVPPEMASKHSRHWVKTLVFTNGLIPSVLIITSIPLVSGMDSSEFHLGWPFDGCAILYKSSFHTLSHILHLTPSNFQACIQALCSVLLHDVLFCCMIGVRGTSTLFIIFLPHMMVLLHDLCGVPHMMVQLHVLCGIPHNDDSVVSHNDCHNFDYFLIAGDFCLTMP